MARAYMPTDWGTQGPRVLELKKAGKTFKEIGATVGGFVTADERGALLAYLRKL